MKISIASGKGGTGKTIISASFATLATNKDMVDADVDAANLYLLLHPANSGEWYISQTACCINKHDLNPRLSGQIEAWCKKNSIPLMGKISYNSDITQAVIQGIPPSEFKNKQASEEIKHVWQNILRLINLNS